MAHWVLLAAAWTAFAAPTPAQGETLVVHEQPVYPQATAAVFLREALQVITVPTRRSDTAVGLPATIAQSFEQGLFDAVILEDDFGAVRVFGCGARPRGQYLTIAQAIPTRVDAMHNLALPAGNCASHVAQVTIPSGTQVFVGQVGGGQAAQFFVRDPSVLTIQSIRILR
jgi:hypothetical protein